MLRQQMMDPEMRLRILSSECLRKLGRRVSLLYWNVVLYCGFLKNPPAIRRAGLLDVTLRSLASGETQ
jgi:hypothetical protein